MKLWQKGNSRCIFLFVFTLDIWEPEQDQYDSNIVINKNQCKCQKSLRIHILSCYSLLLLLLVFFELTISILHHQWITLGLRKDNYDIIEVE